MGEASYLLIPNFIKARSPKRLRVLMYETNKRDGVQHDWKHVQWVESEKAWYAWYMQKINLENAMLGSIDGD